MIWEPIDGPGGILATARVCGNPATKAIDGFVITIDTDDAWSVLGNPVKFDVQNVLTHEFGHVAGLGHVNAPKDGCLTMYKLAGRGETQKSILGFGDQRGMKALYGEPETPQEGPCGSLE